VTGEELRRLRTRLGLTQGQFGQRLGVHLVTICRWETNRVRIPEPIAKLVRFVMKDLTRRPRKG
jgi:DNA-binding transcriptional regulator YiaG